jgi:ferredoxin
VKVRVDRAKCSGHNRCVAFAPALFDIDDAGFSFELGDGVVPPDQIEAAHSAVANCPEEAIVIDEEQA